MRELCKCYYTLLKYRLCASARVELAFATYARGSAGLSKECFLAILWRAGNARARLTYLLLLSLL